MAEYAGFRTEIYIHQGDTVGPPPEPIWVRIAQVVDLDGPEAESDQIEVSHRDSRYRRYVAGMVDGGEVAFDVILDLDHASHDPTDPDSMYAKLDSGVVDDYRMVFPGAEDDTTEVTFDAFVSNFSISSPLEDGLKADLALKITGALTWAHVPGEE